MWLISILMSILLQILLNDYCKYYTIYMTNNRTVKNNSLNYNIIQQDKREKEMTVKEFFKRVEEAYSQVIDNIAKLES